MTYLDALGLSLEHSLTRYQLARLGSRTTECTFDFSTNGLL